MDGKLVKINMVSAKYGKDGGLAEYEKAQIQLDVPLDSPVQREAVQTLIDYLRGQDIRILITSAKEPSPGNLYLQELDDEERE